MSSTITVWTSLSTAACQSRVAQLISATRAIDAHNDSISLAGLSVDEVKESLKNSFNRLVTMTMADSTLHIVAIIPLYEVDASNQIQSLFDACTSSDHNISLHILGLAQGISHIFKADNKVQAIKDAFEKSHSILKELSKQSSFAISHSIIDDYAENGAPIGFTIESLSRYIATFLMALMQGYY